MAGGEFWAEYPDFLAVAILIVFVVILAIGVKTSSKVTMSLCALNLVIVIFIIGEFADDVHFD